MEREGSFPSLDKIRHFAATRFGYGVKSEAFAKTLVYNMKGKDLKRILWFACSYHCNRIYRDFFTFRTETVNVKIEQGELRGRKVTSALGKPYYRFQGIPYAKPPIGPLRFKDPEPPEPWTGVRDALKEGDICIHKDIMTGLLKGSENCLFLNVYTSQLPEPNVQTEGKAVLFWIHGGGFQLGSGNAEIYGPDFLISEDVILITINYRLGALGFLSTGTEDAPGNAGLKDMVMALKWTKKNIAAFGGDPERITIFGESAGGAAVEYLLLSPTAKGLFHSAISQSGNASCPWAFSSNMREAAFKFGRAFGFDTSDPKILVESLRKIPAKIIATKQNTALSDEKKRSLIPFQFCPCAEPENYPHAFITRNPREMIEEGDIASDVPYITGINEMEGMVLLKAIMDKRPPASEIDKDFERLVPPFLNLSYHSDKSKEVASKIRECYFQGKVFNKSTYKEYIDLTTDTHFAEGVILATKKRLKYLKSPVYNYLFLFEGNCNLFKKILNIQNIPGPAHSDELAYIFHIPILGPNLDPKTREMILTKRMIRMWANFAKYRNPTPDANDDLLENVVWPPSNEQDAPYLIINDQLSTSVDYMKERMKLWDDLKEKCGLR